MKFLMKYPGGKEKALTLSYDDGVVQDIKLVSILDKYGLKATFNVNTETFPDKPDNNPTRRMTKKEMYDLYANSGHEVAVHTCTHPDLAALSENNITMEILKDRDTIEKTFGTIARGMAYPFGTYSDKVVDCMKACGIVYSRTTKSTFGFDMPSDWLRLTPTCHHNADNLMQLAKNFEELQLRGWDSTKLFYLWGHSYEFYNNNNWNVIEEFAAEIGGRDDIWYATNIEIYDYVKAYESLIYSCSTSKVHNPTCTDIWITDGQDKPVKIPAGATVTVE